MSRLFRHGGDIRQLNCSANFFSPVWPPLSWPATAGHPGDVVTSKRCVSLPHSEDVDNIERLPSGWPAVADHDIGSCRHQDSFRYVDFPDRIVRRLFIHVVPIPVAQDSVRISGTNIHSCTAMLQQRNCAPVFLISSHPLPLQFEVRVFAIDFADQFVFAEFHSAHSFLRIWYPPLCADCAMRVHNARDGRGK